MTQRWQKSPEPTVLGGASQTSKTAVNAPVQEISACSVQTSSARRAKDEQPPPEAHERPAAPCGGRARAGGTQAAAGSRSRFRLETTRLPAMCSDST